MNAAKTYKKLPARKAKVFVCSNKLLISGILATIRKTK
jgi:hypothetical protein